MLTKILCVCSWNMCRSVMINAILGAELKSRGLQNIIIESAGIKPEAQGKHPSEKAVVILEKHGFDVSNHTGRYVGNINLSNYSKFIVATSHEVDELKGQGVSTDKIVNLDIPNPSGDQSEYDKCYILVYKALTPIIDRLELLYK